MKRGRKVTASKKAGAKKAAAAEEVEETAEGMDVTEPVENEAAPASGVSESTASQSISDSTTLPVPTTIHVTGLQRPWNDEELKSRVIAVSGSDIVDYHVNDRRSEAFVTLGDLAFAEKAVAGMDQKTLNDKPGAKIITVKLHDPNSAPSASESRADSMQDVTPMTEPPLSLAEAIDKFHKEEQERILLTKGFMATKTEPVLYFRPRQEEQIAIMRKRRNYELDSSTMSGRFYHNRDNRHQRHHRGGNDMRVDPRD